MSSFKIKNNKKIKQDIRITLDAKHQEQLKKFKLNDNKLPNLQKKLLNDTFKILFLPIILLNKTLVYLCRDSASRALHIL